MKEYSYKIYDRAGVFISTLSTVENRHPSFSMDLMGGVGALSLQLARTRVDFCSCTDLIMGNELRIIEKNGGVQVYSGYINRASTGQDTAGKEYVRIECLGYVSEFQRRLVEDVDGDTGLQANSSDPADMMTDIIGLYDGKITAGTITATGVVADCVWNGSTVMDAINSIMDRLPNTWFWFVDGNNHLNLKNTGTTPAHILTVGREIGQIDLVVSMDSIINDVRVAGGTPDGAEQVFGRYQNASSQSVFGKSQKIVSDGRVFDPVSLAYIGASNMNPSPVGEAVFEVFDNGENAKGYDIESIQLGDVVLVKDPAQSASMALWDDANWDEAYFDTHPNDILGMPLVITRIEYAGDRVRVTASDTITKRGRDLETVKRNLDAFQNQSNPIGTTV